MASLHSFVHVPRPSRKTTKAPRPPRPANRQAAWRALRVLLPPHARYEDIRRRLVRLFEWRLSTEPEERADEAVRRVARLAEETAPAEGAAADLRELAYQIAREMLDERRIAKPPESAPAAPPAPDDPERRRACLAACLDRLPAGERRLVLLAHQGDGKDRAAARRRLASELGISEDDLRLRVHRARCALEACCARCRETYERGDAAGGDVASPQGGRHG